MAQGKKDGGKASQKKQDDRNAQKKAAEKEASEEASSKSAHVAKAEEPHEEAKAASDDHGHDAHGAHGHHKPNRKEYFYVFLVLAALTALEVVVAQVPGISKVLLGLALVGLAVTKAAAVGLYYMHLKQETRIMRLTVAIPMATPAVYALVLITEGAWRLAR